MGKCMCTTLRLFAFKPRSCVAFTADNNYENSLLTIIRSYALQVLYSKPETTT